MFIYIWLICVLAPENLQTVAHVATEILNTSATIWQLQQKNFATIYSIPV